MPAIRVLWRTVVRIGRVNFLLGALAVALGIAWYDWQSEPPVAEVLRPMFLGTLFAMMAWNVWRVFRGRSRRQASGSTAGAAFVGARSFGDADRNEFVGREHDIDILLDRLREPDLRFLSIVGESGAGKSSLLRAALMPRLRDDSGYWVAYVRLDADPHQRLRDALAREQDATDSDSADASPTTDLWGAWLAATGKCGTKRPVLVLDQFEDLLTRRTHAEIRDEILAFLRRGLSDPTRPMTLVIAIRDSEFGSLSQYADTFGNPFERRARWGICAFDRQTADRVVEHALRRVDELSRWSPALRNAVLDDLAEVRQSAAGVRRETILPADLQIVCSSIVARGIREPDQYPGKAALMRDYVIRAIQATGDPTAATRVLDALLDDTGTERAAPRSLSAIAASVDGVSKTRVERVLDDLRRGYRLVTRGVHGSGKWVSFELSHDALVPILHAAADPEVREQRRARSLLQNWRATATVLSGSDAWFALRHAGAHLSNEEVRVLRRRVGRSLAKAALGLAVLSFVVIGIRVGIARFDVQVRDNGIDVVVTRAGLGALSPLLGSEDVLLDTDVPVSWLSEAGQTAVRRGVLSVRGWGEHGRDTAARIRPWLKAGIIAREEAFEDERLVSAVVGLGLADQALLDRLLESGNVSAVARLFARDPRWVGSSMGRVDDPEQLLGLVRALRTSGADPAVIRRGLADRAKAHDPALARAVAIARVAFDGPLEPALGALGESARPFERIAALDALARRAERKPVRVPTSLLGKLAKSAPRHANSLWHAMTDCAGRVSVDPGWAPVLATTLDGSLSHEDQWTVIQLLARHLTGHADPIAAARADKPFSDWVQAQLDRRPDAVFPFRILHGAGRLSAIESERIAARWLERGLGRLPAEELAALPPCAGLRTALYDGILQDEFRGYAGPDVSEAGAALLRNGLSQAEAVELVEDVLHAAGWRAGDALELAAALRVRDPELVPRLVNRVAARYDQYVDELEWFGVFTPRIRDLLSLHLKVGSIEEAGCAARLLLGSGDPQPWAERVQSVLDRFWVDWHEESLPGTFAEYWLASRLLTRSQAVEELASERARASLGYRLAVRERLRALIEAETDDRAARRALWADTCSRARERVPGWSGFEAAALEAIWQRL